MSYIATINFRSKHGNDYYYGQEITSFTYYTLSETDKYKFRKKHELDSDSGYTPPPRTFEESTFAPSGLFEDTSYQQPSNDFGGGDGGGGGATGSWDTSSDNRSSDSGSSSSD